MQPGCPWYKLSSLGLPNVKWCEATRCSWITEPANTWSNLAYIIAGIIIFMMLKPENRKTSKWFGATLIFVGFSSFVYHMSYTFVFQVLDFIAMYVLTVLMIVINIKRISKITDRQMFQVFNLAVAFFTIVTVVFYYAKVPIQSLVLILSIAIASTEVYIRFKLKQRPKYLYYWLGLFFILAAATFSALDASRILCFPYHPYIQGHAIWHVLATVSLYFIFLFYRQFEEQKVI